MFNFLKPETKEERKQLEYKMEIVRTVGSLATVITMFLNLTLFMYQVRIVTSQVKQINQTEVIK